jgi:hypothetical protein
MLRRLLTATLLLSLALPSAAEEIVVPIETQAAILLKILTFDRNLADHPGDALKIGVLYQPRVRSSRAVFEAFREAIAKNATRSIAGRTITVHPIEAENEAEVRRELSNAPVDVLYVTPLRAVPISSVVELTRRRSIVSFTGVRAYVDQGISVGLSARGQKPEIVINIAANRAEGADFGAQLLKMARIIQ